MYISAETASRRISPCTEKLTHLSKCTAKLFWLRSPIKTRIAEETSRSALISFTAAAQSEEGGCTLRLKFRAAEIPPICSLLPMIGWYGLLNRITERRKLNHGLEKTSSLRTPRKLQRLPVTTSQRKRCNDRPSRSLPAGQTAG